MSANKFLKEIKFCISESKEIDLNTKPVTKRKRRVDDYDYEDDFIEPFEGEHELVDLECKLENFFVYKGKLPYSGKRLIGFHRRKMLRNEKKLQDEEVKVENINNDASENKPVKRKQNMKKAEVKNEEKDPFVREIEKVVGMDLSMDSNIKAKSKKRRSPRKSLEDKNIEEAQKKLTKVGRPKKLTQSQLNLDKQNFEAGNIGHKNTIDQQRNIQMDEKMSDIRINHGNVYSLSNSNGYNTIQSYNRNNIPYQNKLGVQRNHLRSNDLHPSKKNSEYLKNVILNDQNDDREYRNMIFNNDLNRNNIMHQYRDGNDRASLNSYFDCENKLMNLRNNPEPYNRYTSQQFKGQDPRNQIFTPEMMFEAYPKGFPNDGFISKEASRHVNRNFDNSQNYEKIVNARNIKYEKSLKNDPNRKVFNNSKVENNNSFEQLSYDKNNPSNLINTSENVKVVKKRRRRKNKEDELPSGDKNFNADIFSSEKSVAQKENDASTSKVNSDPLVDSATNDDQYGIYNKFKEPLWNYIYGKMIFLSEKFDSTNSKIFFYYFSIILFRENKKDLKDSLKKLKVIKSSANGLKRYFTEKEIKDWYVSVTSTIEKDCDQILKFATNEKMYSKNLSCFNMWKNTSFRKLCLEYIYSFICKDIFDEQNDSPSSSFKAAKDSVRSLFNAQCKTAKFMIHINSMIRKLIADNDFSV